jgi:hypothetical protein
VVAAVTVAIMPLNCTILSAAAALKLAPEMVTVVPTLPVAGVKPVMVGGTMGASLMHENAISNKNKTMTSNGNLERMNDEFMVFYL